MRKDLLQFTPKGIYCFLGGFYVDPWEPVAEAVITHAHSDHAKTGHTYYMRHHHSVPILKQRLGRMANEANTLQDLEDMLEEYG